MEGENQAEETVTANEGGEEQIVGEAAESTTVTTAVVADGGVGDGKEAKNEQDAARGSAEKVREENGTEKADAGGEETGEAVDDEDMDAELEEMKQKLKEMEDEAAKLKDIQEASAAEVSGGNRPVTQDADNRSIYVGNVDYGATPEELKAHFQDCGAINRVTILCNKFTGQPKGFAYIEFAEEEAVNNATILNESTFRGRQLKVNPKRTNLPGVSSTDRGRGRGRGRGRVFRGSYRAGYRGRYAPY